MCYRVTVFGGDIWKKKIIPHGLNFTLSKDGMSSVLMLNAAHLSAVLMTSQKVIFQSRTDQNICTTQG